MKNTNKQLCNFNQNELYYHKMHVMDPNIIFVLNIYIFF